MDPIFLSTPTYNSGAMESQWVAVGDVNGDGVPDVVVATSQCPDSYCSIGTVGVLLGNGDGTFQPTITYGSGGVLTTSVAVGDVNGDAKPDLVVTNGCADVSCANGSVGVLLGNGDGSFQTAVSYSSGGLTARSVVVGDVNFDGRPDLVVVNRCQTISTDCSGSVGVLFGNGDGSFQAVITYNSGASFGKAVTIGDVNMDGIPDLVVVNGCSASVCTNGVLGVLLGNGDGSFETAMTYDSAGNIAQSVAFGDLNGDGKPDLAVANFCSLSYCSPGNGLVGVLLGNGDGTFQTAMIFYSGGLGARSVVVGDVNGDSNPDLVVTNECADANCTNGNIAVLRGDGGGNFNFEPVSYSSGGGLPSSVATGDLNGDGKPDLVVANFCADSSCTQGSVGVLLGNGDGSFLPSYGSAGESA